MRDMADSQTDNGLVPNIAPEYTVFPGTFRAAAEWGCAFILVPWQQYQFTGDTALMREYYAAMKRYMEYLASRATDHILDEGPRRLVRPGPGRSARRRPAHAAAGHRHGVLLLRRAADVADCAAARQGRRTPHEYAKLADEIRAAWLAQISPRRHRHVRHRIRSAPMRSRW